MLNFLIDRFLRLYNKLIIVQKKRISQNIEIMALISLIQILIIRYKR